MNESRPGKLFRDGLDQAVHIPRDFELPGTDVVIRKLGESIVIDPKKALPLLELLATLKPIEDDFGDMPELEMDQPPEFL